MCIRDSLRVVVEFEPQSRIEGEIQQMPADYPVIELAQVLRGEAVARRSASDITLVDAVGFALEDYSALRFLHALISQQRLGRRDLDLVPVLDDPKDLFGILRDAPLRGATSAAAVADRGMRLRAAA
mgnify:CR=1 FL=1